MTKAFLYLITGAVLLYSCSSSGKDVAATHSKSRDLTTSLAVAEQQSVRAIEPDQPLPGSADGQPYTDDRSNRTGANAIRPALVMVGRFDGEPILDFKLESRCQTAFVTRAGTTVIDWSRVGDFARHIERDRVSIPLDDGSGVHVVSLPKAKRPEPVGDASVRVDSAFAMFYFGCNP